MAVAVALVATGPAKAEPAAPAQHVQGGARVDALIGKDAATVARLAGDVGSEAPGPPGLSALDGDAHVDIYSSYGFAQRSDDKQRCGLRVGRGVSGQVPVPYEDRAEEADLVFRDGKLASVVAARKPAPTPVDVNDFNAQHAAREAAARQNPFIERPGELPLTAGIGAALPRLGAPLPPDALLAVVCTDVSPFVPPPPRAGRAQFDEDGPLQGVALLPFAAGLPGLNAERRRAAQEGPALMATLAPGQVLKGGPDAFAAAHDGVRVYRDDDSGYAVLVVNLGAPTSRNLTRDNRAGFVGVRGDRIVWVSSSVRGDRVVWAYVGWFAPTMCLNARGRLGRTRPGCDAYGSFSP